MQKHIIILGVSYIAFGIMSALIALIVFAVGVGGMDRLSGDIETVTKKTYISSVIAILLIAISVPEVISSIMLLKLHMESWTRNLVLILGAFNLILIPFGTILGIYTICVLSKDEGIELLASD